MTGAVAPPPIALPPIGLAQPVAADSNAATAFWLPWARPSWLPNAT
jgi:hypothetical protein